MCQVLYILHIIFITALQARRENFGSVRLGPLPQFLQVVNGISSAWYILGRKYTIYVQQAEIICYYRLICKALSIVGNTIV